MPRTSLLTSMIARWDASVLPGSFPSNLWLGSIPERFSLPFCALMHGGEIPGAEDLAWTTESATSGGTYIETGAASFVVYHDNLTTAENLAGQIMDAFDWAPLAFGGGDSLVKPKGFIRTNYLVTSEPLRESDGSWVYRVQVDYRARVNRVNTATM